MALLHLQDYESVEYYPAAPMLDITIFDVSQEDQQVKLTTLVDSGADATMLPINLLRQANARYLRTHRMRGVTGQSIPVDTYLVSVEIGTIRLNGIEVVAMQTGAEAVVGRDVLNNFRIVLDGLAQAVEIQDAVSL